jgi:hyaluronate lyase
MRRTDGGLARRTLLAAPEPPGSPSPYRLLAGGPALALAADELTDLRDRWRDIVTGASRIDPAHPEFAAAITRLDNSITSRLATIDRTSGRDRVFTDLPMVQTTESSMITQTNVRLAGLAAAYRTPGSQYQGSTNLLADILSGLDTADRVTYHSGRTPSGSAPSPPFSEGPHRVRDRPWIRG